MEVVTRGAHREGLPRKSGLRVGAYPSNAVQTVSFGTPTGRARTSYHARVLLLGASILLMAGCAQTMWVRPDTSVAETQGTINRCDYEADLRTPASTIHLRGRHTVGKALAEGLMGALEEGIRKASLSSSCMVANGFHRELVQPAPTILIASATRLPDVQSSTRVLEDRETSSFSGAKPEQSIVLNPPNPHVFDVSGPNPLSAVARIPVNAPGVGYPNDSRVYPIRAAAEPSDRRQLLTQQFMDLPDTSKLKVSFLSGACSAGDSTACIMWEALAPDSRKAANMYR